MRVIVTGGSGFIGTNLIEHFAANGDDILNIDIVSPRNTAHVAYWLNIDLCNVVLLRKAIHDFQPDVLFHMGARTDLNGADISAYSANTQGVENLITSIEDLSSLQRIVFASSRLVCRIGYQPVNDSDYCPTTPYGESKVISEKIVRNSSARIPCSWLIVRPTSIWGPWFDVPYKTFFTTIARGSYFHPGSDNILKSFGFVGNTVYELGKLLLADSKKINGKTFYLADYPPIDVRNMANLIQKEFGVVKIRQLPFNVLVLIAKIGDIAKYFGMNNPPITTFRLNNLVSEMVHDLEPLREIAGELPFSLEDGVSRTVEWMRGRPIEGK